MHPATIFILLLLLSFGLKKDEQEWILFSLAIALPIAGVIGFGIFRSNEVCNTIFWVLFILLCTAPQFENFYIKLFSLIKQFIKYILK